MRSTKRGVLGLVVAVTVCIVGTVSATNLRWGEETGFITGFGGADLAYSDTDGTAGAFAQLIWCGGDGLIDAFNAGSTTGVSGDDQVVDVSFSRNAFFSTATTNQFAYQTVANGIIGQPESGYKYYVRVYNAALGTWTDTATDPFPGTATYYYETGATTFTWNDTVTFVDLNIAGGGTVSTLTPIPEPSTMLLFGLGALTLVARRAKRK